MQKPGCRGIRRESNGAAAGAERALSARRAFGVRSNLIRFAYLKGGSTAKVEDGVVLTVSLPGAPSF